MNVEDNEQGTTGKCDVLVETLRRSRSDGLKHGLTFVITGATSGIGLEACKLLAMMNPTNRIVMVARTQEKADAAKEAVVKDVWAETSDRCRFGENITAMECDHCSIESVRKFALSDLPRKLEETYCPSKWAMNGIDVLCLNAAVLQPNDSKAVFTRDGFEVTFQTNHLAPFLIANLLRDYMNYGGRIVFSTSGLHCSHQLCFDGAVDGETGKLLKYFEMLDGTDFHFKRSYSLAKLCNVAVCVELNKRLRPQRVISTCFSPGLMMSSGLFRNQPRCGGKVATVPQNKDILMREKTVQWGAGSLVYMAIADATGEKGAQYWRDADSFAGSDAVYGEEFSPTSIAEEPNDIQKREILWKLSCHWTDLDCRI